jgi:hypothetical protein
MHVVVLVALYRKPINNHQHEQKISTRINTQHTIRYPK